MSRCIFTGFFVFIILFQSMDRFGMIAFYELNKAYITEMFCVNKSRPELGCEGKCFLMQKLNQNNQQDDSVPAKVLDAKEIHLFPIHNPDPRTSGQDLQKNSTAYIQPLNFRSFIFDIFHPPQFS